MKAVTPEDATYRRLLLSAARAKAYHHCQVPELPVLEQ
jgi:hypothetical protein